MVAEPMIPAELRRGGALGRFPHPTEEEYQDWLVAQMRPVMTFGGVVAGLIFLTNPFTHTWFGTASPDVEILFLTSSSANGHSPNAWAVTL